MKTITVTVRIVPCADCNGSGYYLANGDGNREVRRDCPTCGDGHGEVVATSERLLVGRRLVWDSFR